MKRSMVPVITGMLLAGFLLAGCASNVDIAEEQTVGSTEKETSEKEKEEETVIDLNELNGSYEDENGANADGYQAAYIEDGKIEIYWVLNNGENINLYWAGDIDGSSVSANDAGYSFISHNDKSKTGMQFLASALDEKEFYVEGDKITFDIVELGDPVTMAIKKTRSDYSKLGVNVEMAEMEDLDEVELEDFGYRVYEADNEVYIYYAVKLKNPNKDYAVLFPRISIVATDADGKIVKTEEVVLMGIAAGDTVYYGNHLSYDGKTADKVDINATNGTYSYEKQEGSNLVKSSELKITDKEEISDDFSRVYKGSIKNNSDKKYKQILLTVIYKNGDEIVGGEITFLQGLSAKSEKKFEILALPNFKEYDNYEIYALPWE